MDFGKALEALKQGKVVAREGWTGKYFLWIIPGDEINSDRCKNPQIKKLVDENGGSIAEQPRLRRFSRVSDGRTVFGRWTPDQSDMLLEDWFILE